MTKEAKMKAREHWFGKGIYSIPDASRLSQVPARSIRRWVLGYQYPLQGKQVEKKPVIAADYPLIGGEIAISFADLVEVRYIEAFRSAGVSWKSIRTAHERARELFVASHPFNLHRFATDGRTIFVQALEVSGEDLLDLVRSQLAFREVLEPYLKGLEFSASGEVIRWWPFEKRKTVVIDPKRSLGQPVVDEFGVPTSVLAASFKAEQSVNRVAQLFGVSRPAVEDAMAFEQQLAA